jgi:23S rRNA (cytidine1920-2'-O)/16S rRNA (cytidine1409-2'-O)-methyltransferase
MPKRRIDLVLVERGLAEDREQAKTLVLAGDVLIDGQPARPGMTVDESAAVSLVEAPAFVSRGGLKLEHALDVFGVDVSGKVAADIGASTGGFTDCLLKHGAARVYAVDVGRGQLDWRLRNDPRVVVMEGVNARFPLDLPEMVDLAAVDVSFISVALVLPNVAAVLKPGGYIIVLVKPQFEAARKEAPRGVVKDPLVHAAVLGRFVKWAAENGFRLLGLTISPVTGPAGNHEFLVLLRPGARG